MKIVLTIIIVLVSTNLFAQPKLWHNKEHPVRYKTFGNDIFIENGTKRFNRALYGGNTAFRAEAGDLPEFALYMPGMGGNLKLGIVVGNKSKWLIEAQYIKAIYRAGCMLYEIKDSLWGNGTIYLTALALYEREGFIVNLYADSIEPNVELVTVYGGATGKKFSRDGDLGADPESSFYLKPEYCTDNIYAINGNSFSLLYGFTKPLTDDERYEVQHVQTGDTKNKKVDDAKKMEGVFMPEMQLKIADATKQKNPFECLNGDSSKTPLVIGSIKLYNSKSLYLYLGKQLSEKLDYSKLSILFNNAEAERFKLANRIKIETPEAEINALGPVLGIAADAVWEDPSYMHGAVAWRMRLNGWRGAYIADVLGWHDRAKKHFDSYALSQLTTPLSGPVVADTALHLGRQTEKVGTSLFSSGYISRNPDGKNLTAHHYDMNLVFVDQLLNNFNWNGDTNYVRKMFPLIKRHLEWEKRNFDVDGDGLYDSYAAIWASDALQYSGGGVTHSSAYNYRSFKNAAMLANLIGEDGTAFVQEANKILEAINKQLWMPNKGSYAEFKDLLGEKLVHPSPGLWTIYHAIDEGICNPFQAYQALRYVDTEIPHIPILASNLADTTMYTLSTTNWQPYTWSLNNVALAEVLHTALSYWQGGRSDEAFKLWKGNIFESMYMSSSPGTIQQLGFYDAIRGELYRDFADPIAMVARTLVEGLFGIQPDALNNSLIIKPGIPKEWKLAGIETPDIKFRYKNNNQLSTYNITQKFGKLFNLKLILPVTTNAVEVMLGNEKLNYKVVSNAIGKPLIEINLPAQKEYTINILDIGKPLQKLFFKKQYSNFEKLSIFSNSLSGFKLYDPQNILQKPNIAKSNLFANFNNVEGHKTFFIQTAQGAFTWWQPIDIYIAKLYKVVEKPVFTAQTNFDKIDLSNYFNDHITNIFKNEYLEPRPKVPTLQLPTQGIGNWAYPLATANINDSGLRIKAGIKNEIITSENIPFATPSDFSKKNILFSSQWNNYPKQIIVPLTGNASHAFLLMAGSTNPMQSRILNGQIVISYTDNTADILQLKNPENWWPIEQDYYIDEYAFAINAKRPMRLKLNTGEDYSQPVKYSSIKGFTGFAVDGGAATILNLSLNINKTLKNITLKTVANDVVIGLMALTLVR